MQSVRSPRAESHPGPDPLPSTASVLPGERSGLLTWLDEGLRNGRRGRLQAEYGPLLRDPGATRHAVADLGGRPIAHAMARLVDVQAAGVRTPLGMIGLVYTDPAFRRRGLAARCVGICEGWLAEAGVPLVALWSDRHDWYARLGYHLAGVEVNLLVDASVCARAGSRLPFEGVIRTPQAGDWPALEALHEQKSSRAARRPGQLRSLASGPDCRVVVARRGSRALAYAALGRGDDFAGIVHDWAGESGAVLACLAHLLADRATLSVLAGPADGVLETALRSAGADAYEGGFALVKPLDPALLWQRLAPDHTELARRGEGFRLTGDGGACDLDGRETVRLLLGPGFPEPAGAAFSPAQRRALGARLPWPLFVGGFDSV